MSSQEFEALCQREVESLKDEHNGLELLRAGMLAPYGFCDHCGLALCRANFAFCIVVAPVMKRHFELFELRTGTHRVMRGCCQWLCADATLGYVYEQEAKKHSGGVFGFFAEVSEKGPTCVLRCSIHCTSITYSPLRWWRGVTTTVAFPARVLVQFT